jgi:hypothetical protein
VEHHQQCIVCLGCTINFGLVNQFVSDVVVRMYFGETGAH